MASSTGDKESYSMATFFGVYGSGIEVSPQNGTDFSLEELQMAVGGFIEVLYLHDDEIMVVNEEGKLKGLAINNKATDYLRRHSDYDDIIVGDVLVCDSSQVK